MKKHVDFDRSILLKKLLKDLASIASRFPLNHELNEKKTCVCPTTISIFFIANKSKKDDAYEEYWVHLTVEASTHVMTMDYFPV
jgi:hypothetical protein